MPRDRKPVHRKTIVPWYDSEGACLVLSLFFGIVVLFGLAGLSAAREYPEFHEVRWVPALLVVLSAMMAVSRFVRLIRRLVDRRRESDLDHLQGGASW